MNALGLSDDQLAERRLRLHAGDATPIMAGEYRRVFRRIKGLDPDDDLSGEFRVQLGSYTEPMNLAWTMRQTGRPVEYYSTNTLCQNAWFLLTGAACNIIELVVCKRYPFMACNLDGMTTTPQGHRSVIDAKHVGRSGEAEILRYTPAGVWQAICAGTDWWGLSMIVGNKWEPPIFQEVDPIYRATMIAKARECWGFIERDEEPPEGMRCDVCGGGGKTRHVIFTFDGDSDRQIPDREEVDLCEECDGTGWIGSGRPVLPPKPQPRLRSIAVPVEADGVFDALCQQNNWLSEACAHIRAIISTDGAAKVNAIHRDVMKTLVPEDVGIVEFGRYKYHKDKAGNARQTVAKIDGNV